MKFFAAFLVVFGLSFIPAVYGQSKLYINELMANSDNVVSDPQGDYDDLIEIYKPIDADIDLDGFFLTDDDEGDAGLHIKWDESAQKPRAT